MSDIDWKSVGMSSAEAIRMGAFPGSQLPQTPAGRVEMVMNLMNWPVVDEDTGEVEYVQLISTELAKKLMEGIG